MAVYSVTTAAIALGVERKVLENLLGRCQIPGTSRGRQGRARRLSQNALLAVAAVLRLQNDFGIPAPRAVDLLADGLLPPLERGRDGRARAAGASDPPGVVTGGVQRGPFLLEVDIDRLERDLFNALRDAIEVSPRPKRGRPPHGTLVSG